MSGQKEKRAQRGADYWSEARAGLSDFSLWAIWQRLFTLAKVRFL